MTLRHRLGTKELDIVSPAGSVLVTHVLHPPGAGGMVRTPEHAVALERAVLSQFTSARPCDRKANKPPGSEALAARAVLLGEGGVEPAVDLDQLAELVHLAFPGARDLSDEVSA
jgi:hypothetical protein